MPDDRRKNGGVRRNGGDKREVVPLRLAEEIVSYDTLASIEHLEDITQSGECVGIAFAAICKEGRFVHGYTGAAVEQPELAAGLLSRLIFNIHKNTES